MSALKKTFISLLSRYSNDEGLIHELWSEIEKNYSDASRHYHTLNHLDNLLAQLIEVKAEIEDWDTLMFTLFYHDIVYRAVKSNNEEKSAELAGKRMLQIGVSRDSIVRCKQQILATKSHNLSMDNDTNYFTDADLSIFGQTWEHYAQYCQNVRREYSMFPDFVFNPGRKKVVQHFLSIERLFKTAFFYTKYEHQAKDNLQKELSDLRNLQ